MPKSVNRPRDEVEAEQMQQGPIDFAEDQSGEQMGDAENEGASAEPQSPA